jgi:hypothetical protein
MCKLLSFLIATRDPVCELRAIECISTTRFEPLARNRSYDFTKPSVSRAVALLCDARSFGHFELKL